MRTPVLLLVLFTAFAAFTPCASAQISPADLQSLMEKAKAELPFLASLPAELKAEADGFYASRDLSLGGRSVTLVAYHPKGSASGRLDLAILMKSCSIGTLIKELDSTVLNQLAMNYAVLIYPLGIKSDAIEAVKLEALPKLVADYVQFSTKTLYLKQGLYLTAKLDPQQQTSEAVSMLKGIGIDLADMSVQCSFNKNRTLLFRRMGEWKNPFQLKNSKMTDATLSFEWSATQKAIAAWGMAEIGSTKALLYAKRVTMNGSPVGDGYGVSSRELTLKALVDVVQALPVDPLPFPLAGLEMLPLERIALANSKYKDLDSASPGEADLTNATFFVATSPQVKLLDGKTGPFIYANGEAKIFGFKAANLQLNADKTQLVANATVNNVKFDALSLGDASFRLTNTSSVHEMAFSGKIDGSIANVKLVNQAVTVFISDSRFKFTASCSLGDLAGISGTFASKTGYAFPWELSLDVSGVAKQIFDTGVQTYCTAKAIAEKAGATFIEPNDVAIAAAHTRNLLKAEAWSDIAKDLQSLGSSSEWEQLAKKIPAGQAFRSADSTITTVTSTGKAAITETVAVAMDAGKGASNFFNNVGSGVKSVGKLFGGGGKKKAKPIDLQKIIQDVFNTKKVMWNGRERTNVATTIGRADASSSAPFVSSVKALADGKDNPPYTDQTTMLFTKLENMPWAELCLQSPHPVEAIVIQTVDAGMPEGLKGAVVALSQQQFYPSTDKSKPWEQIQGAGDFLMRPGVVPQYYITQPGSLTVIEPSMGNPGYRELRNAVETAATELGASKDADKTKLQAAYERAYDAYARATSPVYSIRVFLPGRGKLVISEIRVIDIPRRDQPELFQNLPSGDTP